MTTLSNEFFGIDHHSIIIQDIEKSRHFYADILGLEIDENRPDLSFDGLWVKVGGQQAIHCLCLENPDPQDNRPEHGGRDRHVCLLVRDINALIDMLEQHYIHYTHSKSGRQAIFFRDPDGNAIEVKQV